MTPARFQILVEGALAIWKVEVEATFATDQTSCQIVTADGAAVVLRFEREPFGVVWRLVEQGRRDRVHISILPALRSLREITAPGRKAGRVLFVQGDQK
ncbi:MAG: hypothetical protein CMM47_11085 [Rhodospirillaceae bacterium]|nr:hypothetical protein [Rhodospirillaceae bacterium]